MNVSIAELCSPHSKVIVPSACTTRLTTETWRPGIAIACHSQRISPNRKLFRQLFLEKESNQVLDLRLQIDCYSNESIAESIFCEVVLTGAISNSTRLSVSEMPKLGASWFDSLLHYPTLWRIRTWGHHFHPIALSLSLSSLNLLHG